MGKQLVITLHPNGTVGAETFGMTGDECLSYITALEDLLDATTVQSSYTADHAAVSAETTTTAFQREQDS